MITLTFTSLLPFTRNAPFLYTTTGLSNVLRFGLCISNVRLVFSKSILRCPFFTVVTLVVIFFLAIILLRRLFKFSNSAFKSTVSAILRLSFSKNHLSCTNPITSLSRLIIIGMCELCSDLGSSFLSCPLVLHPVF